MRCSAPNDCGPGPNNVTSVNQHRRTAGIIDDTGQLVDSLPGMLLLR
jgi:hypothetical protein